MDWNSIKSEEGHVLNVFFDLLRSIGHGWEYTLSESPREWVICIYKEDGEWGEYMIQDGRRIDFNSKGKSIYDICLEDLKNIDPRATDYLVNNFIKEVGDWEQEKSKIKR